MLDMVWVPVDLANLNNQICLEVSCKEDQITSAQGE